MNEKKCDFRQDMGFMLLFIFEKLCRLWHLLKLNCAVSMVVELDPLTRFLDYFATNRSTIPTQTPKTTLNNNVSCVRMKVQCIAQRHRSDDIQLNGGTASRGQMAFPYFTIHHHMPSDCKLIDLSVVAQYKLTESQMKEMQWLDSVISIISSRDWWNFNG